MCGGNTTLTVGRKDPAKGPHISQTRKHGDEIYVFLIDLVITFVVAFIMN